MRAEISLSFTFHGNKNALVLTKLINQQFNRVRVVLPVIEQLSLLTEPQARQSNWSDRRRQERWMKRLISSVGTFQASAQSQIEQGIINTLVYRRIENASHHTEGVLIWKL